MPLTSADLVALLDLEPAGPDRLRRPLADASAGRGSTAGRWSPRRWSPPRAPSRSGAPFPARLFPAGRRSRRADPVRGRAHSRRPQLHDPARRRPPARRGDLRSSPPPSTSPRRGSTTKRRRRSAPDPNSSLDPAAATAPLGEKARKRLQSAVRAHSADRVPPARSRADTRRSRAGETREPRQSVWIRIGGPLPDDPPIHTRRAGLSLRHDAARHGAGRPRPRHVRRPSSRSPASITRCGSTAPAAPTSGCSMSRTARAPAARAALTRGAHLHAATARWPRASPRKG